MGKLTSLGVNQSTFKANVYAEKKEDRMMMTGLHTVADIYFVKCGSYVGWRYKFDFEKNQQYKEGKSIHESASPVGNEFPIIFLSCVTKQKNINIGSYGKNHRNLVAKPLVLLNLLGSCICLDSPQNHYFFVLGPTGKKMQRKLPEMKLEKKKKKLDTMASPTQHLSKRKPKKGRSFLLLRLALKE
ncbi:hypothetical protein YC2023_098397 [Brassica napus]